MVEFKEVKTKSGKVIVFCNLEEFLTDYYGVRTMDEVEQFANSNDEYICHCPFCKAEGHTKHKLYINKDLSVGGHCFVCTRSFIHISDQVDVSFRPLENFNFNFQNKFELIKLSDPVWSLDKFGTEFDDFSQVGYNYLVNRHGFMKELYKLLDFKFWNDNVVIPFKYHGEIFYYQIRFTGTNNIKYFHPRIEAKPCYIIEHGDEETHKKFVIVEGVFDAIAALIQCPEYTPCAVLGSSISDYQISMIRDYAGCVKEIKIWMDETKISKGIQDKIKQTIDYAPVSIIKSYGPDPEEIMIEKIKKGLPLQLITKNNKNDISLGR